MKIKLHDPGVPVPVAQVFVNLDTGGAERHALALLRHLDRRRFAPRVLCLSARGALAGAVEQLGVPVDCPRLDPRRLWTPAAQVQLVRWFRKHRIRIAHTHMFHANCYGRMAAMLAGVPVRIASVHNVKDAVQRKHRGLLRRLDRFTDRTIAVSAAVKASLAASGLYSPEKIAVVMNGVEVPPPSTVALRAEVRRELELSAETRVLIMVARMIPIKRHEDLLNALAGLPPELADTALVLVGGGPRLAALEEQAHRLGLAARVRFLGERQDVERLLAAADAAVLCSEHEGLGIVLLEAMAAGLPVVASRVGGIPEVVTPETGLLYESGDVAGLRAALERILADPVLRRALGVAGRRRVEEQFSAASMTRCIEWIYEDCLAGA